MYVGGAAGLGGEHWVDWIIIPLLPPEIKNFSCAADSGRHQQLHEQLGQQAGRS
jgi:hypothetical protein